MKKRNYLQEIQNLKKWCTVLLEFLCSKYPEYKVAYDTTIQSWNREFPDNKKVLKGFIDGRNDFLEIAKDMPAADLAELDSMLISKFGEGIFDVDKQQVKGLKAIIKSGKILNDEQYRLVESRVDELCQTTPDAQEIEILNQLLIDYHNKK